jgi:hypothetical protein
MAHLFLFLVGEKLFRQPCLSVCPSVCPSVHLFVCPPVYPSVCPSVHPSVCPSLRLSVCPSVRLSEQTSDRIFFSLIESRLNNMNILEFYPKTKINMFDRDKNFKVLMLCRQVCYSLLQAQCATTFCFCKW